MRSVSFPMYAYPPKALALFWKVLHEALEAEGLTGAGFVTPTDLAEHWVSGTLLLSQTCGYPLTHALKGRVRLVGTPCHHAPGCAGTLYSSVFVCREDDPAATLEELRGRRAAFNSKDSQSGYNALRHAVAPLARGGRFFAETLETGAHRLSMQSVQNGDADTAAIDGVTFALARDAGQAGGLRILGLSKAVPGLPLVTSSRTSDAELAGLRRALASLLRSELAAPALAAMRIVGFTVTDSADYAGITEMELAAIEAGYPSLA